MLPDGLSPTEAATFCSWASALAGPSAALSMERFSFAEATPLVSSVLICLLKSLVWLRSITMETATWMPQVIAPRIMPVRAAVLCWSAWSWMLFWTSWLWALRISRAASRCFWPTSTRRAISL